MQKLLVHSIHQLDASIEMSEASPLVETTKWGTARLCLQIPAKSAGLTRDWGSAGIEHVADGVVHRVFQTDDATGIEISQILTKRPATNILQYALETSGIDLFYQGKLSSAEIQEGCERPEKIVGSYAVYEKKPRNGDFFKVGHIYRPEAWDSAGHRVVCQLEADQKELRVVVPLDFLASAVYPVTVDPEFGYSSAPGTYSTASSNRWYAAKGTPAGSGSVDWIKAYVRRVGTGDDPTFKGMLVLGSTKGIVTNGLGPSVSISNTTPGWLECDFSSKPLVSAVDYWVGAIFYWPGAAAYYYFDDAGENTNAAYDTSNSYSSPTDPTDLSTQNRYYGFYASYTADAGALPIPVAMAQYRQRWG